MFCTIPMKFIYYRLIRRSYADALPPRVLPYWDLTYLLSGTMEYYYNDAHVLLRGGDVLLFPSGAKRQRVPVEGPVHYASFNVQLPDSLVPAVSGHLPGCVEKDTLLLLELFQRSWHNASVCQTEQCTALFSYLYARLIDACANRQNPHIQKIKQYIESHLEDDITLKGIAASVYLAPTYCSTLFSEKTGQSIFEYVLHRRIDLAKRLLIIDDMPLSEVARHAGFSDYTYFSRTFKKLAGISPMQYKNIKTKK